MNDIIVNKWAMGLAVFSFGFLSIGSFLFGATATTSLLRGLGGGVLFGASLWLAGLLVNEEKDEIEGDPEEEVNAEVESTQESTQKTASFNPNAVKEKFLKKSVEIAEKEEKDKEEKYNQEATPF
jgi:apolipoprotein N-acyltransferase